MAQIEFDVRRKRCLVNRSGEDLKRLRGKQDTSEEGNKRIAPFSHHQFHDLERSTNPYMAENDGQPCANWVRLKKFLFNSFAAQQKRRSRFDPLDEILKSRK